MALNNLGNVEVRRGDLSRARAHLLEALRLAYRLGNRRRIAYTLAAVSELVAAEGQNELAVMLDATVAATLAKIGAPLPKRSEEPVTQTVPGGPMMSLERAVEHTLALLATAVAAGPGGDTMPSAPRAVPLTRREREVVALVTQGLTNGQIAEALVLTEGTVENYVQRTLGKLGFNNRAQIAVWAVEHGFGLPHTT
jgi:DNA-binding NarL/FixJ family response regulator